MWKRKLIKTGIGNSSFLNKEENERVHMWVQCTKLQMFFTFEIDQLHQDLFSFESDIVFAENVFTRSQMITNGKIRHHAIADDFTFISANLISLIHLHCVVEIF